MTAGPQHRRPLVSLPGAEAGVSALEFALVAPILVLLLINLVDFSFMIWSQMELDNSAQVGAQAAYTTCSPSHLPAKTKCTNLASVVTTAIQSTPLGTDVTLASGSPSENYYCTNGMALQSVGSYSSPPNPFNCAAAGDSSKSPGDYVAVNVSYSYAPIFQGLSLAPTQILTGSAILRLQ